jgi:hypothetical protein
MILQSLSDLKREREGGSEDDTSGDDSDVFSFFWETMIYSKINLYDDSDV